jgi:hypothetical protein
VDFVLHVWPHMYLNEPESVGSILLASNISLGTLANSGSIRPAMVAAEVRQALANSAPELRDEALQQVQEGEVDDAQYRRGDAAVIQTGSFVDVPVVPQILMSAEQQIALLDRKNRETELSVYNAENAVALRQFDDNDRERAVQLERQKQELAFKREELALKREENAAREKREMEELAIKERIRKDELATELAIAKARVRVDVEKEKRATLEVSAEIREKERSQLGLRPLKNRRVKSPTPPMRTPEPELPPPAPPAKTTHPAPDLRNWRDVMEYGIRRCLAKTTKGLGVSHHPQTVFDHWYAALRVGIVEDANSAKILAVQQADLLPNAVAEIIRRISPMSKEVQSGITAFTLGGTETAAGYSHLKYIEDAHVMQNNYVAVKAEIDWDELKSKVGCITSFDRLVRYIVQRCIIPDPRGVPIYVDLKEMVRTWICAVKNNMLEDIEWTDIQDVVERGMAKYERWAEREDSLISSCSNTRRVKTDCKHVWDRRWRWNDRYVMGRLNRDADVFQAKYSQIAAILGEEVE